MSATVYPNAEAIFYQRYSSTRRDELVGVLLALFLGGFGAHHFYLRRIGMGIFYLCFSWTPLPWFLGFIECFFMPGRVREFNAIEAAAIAGALGIPVPYSQAYRWAPYAASTAQSAYAPQAAGTAVATLQACPRCRATNVAGARFCGSCGAELMGG